MKFDLNLLLVFDAVMKERSVTRASERLGLSQPAVSAALGRLRGLFQDPLFIKTTNGMTPTERARELFAPFGEAISLIEETVRTREQFDPASSRRLFRIMMMDVGEIEFLPILLQHISQMRYSVGIETLQPALPQDQLVSKFEAGAIDLALGYWPQFSARRGFESQLLFRDTFSCVLRPDHPLIGDSMSHEQYCTARHVVVTTSGKSDGIIEQALHGQDIRRVVAARVPHFLAVPDIVEGSDLVATMPSRLARTLCRKHRLRVVEPPLHFDTFEVNVYTHKSLSTDPGLRWIKDTIVKLCTDVPAEDDAARSPQCKQPDTSHRQIDHVNRLHKTYKLA